MQQVEAFLFDLNGTMIDDMQYHIHAWHRILNGLGANISLERMKEECYGKNHDVIERILPGKFSYAEKDRMSLEKEQEYQQEFRPYLKLIKGLDSFLSSAHKNGFKLAIGSAAIMFNIEYVVDGLGIRKYFEVLVSADDVMHSKPHPETWLQCARNIGVPEKNCLVFEDAPKGAESAMNAGMPCVVITTLHKKEEFRKFENVIAFIKNYDDPIISSLLNGKGWKKD